MRRSLRLFSFLLMAVVLVFGNGLSMAVGDPAHGNAVNEASSDPNQVSHDHHGGAAGHEMDQHCGTVSCVSAVGIQTGRGVFPTLKRFLKFSFPPQDRFLRSAYLAGDPPVPRSFS